MGNIHYHWAFLYDTNETPPGIVTLHDFCLAGFHDWYASHRQHDPEFISAARLRYVQAPGRAAENLAAAR